MSESTVHGRVVAIQLWVGLGNTTNTSLFRGNGKFPYHVLWIMVYLFSALGLGNINMTKA